MIATFDKVLALLYLQKSCWRKGERIPDWQLGTRWLENFFAVCDWKFCEHMLRNFCNFQLIKAVAICWYMRVFSGATIILQQLWRVSYIRPPASLPLLSSPDTTIWEPTSVEKLSKMMGTELLEQVWNSWLYSINLCYFLCNTMENSAYTCASFRTKC